MRRPELAVRRQPVVELCERLRPDAIQAALGLHARLDEPGVLEHTEMFGHGRLADAEAIDELTDGPFTVAEQIEDRQPARFRQNLERSERRHEPIVFLSGYMSVK